VESFKEIVDVFFKSRNPRFIWQLWFKHYCMTIYIQIFKFKNLIVFWWKTKISSLFLINFMLKGIFHILDLIYVVRNLPYSWSTLCWKESSIFLINFMLKGIFHNLDQLYVVRYLPYSWSNLCCKESSLFLINFLLKGIFHILDQLYVERNIPYSWSNLCCKVSSIILI